MQSICGRVDSINNITTKMDIIRKAFRACGDSAFSDNAYVKELKRIYKYSLNKTEFKSKLKEIEKWCQYRNQIVHAMFNKDIEALRLNYKEHVERGYQLGRYVDRQVQALKRV